MGKELELLGEKKLVLYRNVGVRRKREVVPGYARGGRRGEGFMVRRLFREGGGVVSAWLTCCGAGSCGWFLGAGR